MMKIFTPNKRFLKFGFILLPFNLILLVLVIIAMMQKNETLLNVATILLLVMILTFTLGSRIIRKDNIIITQDKIQYSLKDETGGIFKILLLQFDKEVIFLNQVESFMYENKLQKILLYTKEGIKTIRLDYFSQGSIDKIIKLIEERI